MEKEKTYNHLTQIGYQKIKRKIRKQDGEQVTLYSNSNDSMMWVLCHQDKDGKILDTRSYYWTEENEKEVKKDANSDYNIWKKFLLLKVQDFEIGMAGLIDLV